jgi:hypothetical protein
MDFHEYIRNDKNCIDFAMWLFNRQTHDEKSKGETIEENMIGYNSPDSKALSPMLQCLQDGVKFKDRDIILWVNNHLRPRLIKYQKQYKTYDTKATFN